VTTAAIFAATVLLQFVSGFDPNTAFVQESFQVVSGMYDLAEASVVGSLGLAPVLKYVDSVPLSLKSVPPTATLKGVDAMPLT